MHVRALMASVRVSHATEADASDVQVPHASGATCNLRKAPQLQVESTSQQSKAHHRKAVGTAFRSEVHRGTRGNACPLPRGCLLAVRGGVLESAAILQGAPVEDSYQA